MVASISAWIFAISLRPISWICAGVRVEGGELEDFGLVVGLAVGEVFGGERGLRVGNVIVAEEGEELAIDGDDVGLDGGGGLGAEAGLVGRGDGRGHLFEGLVVDGGLGRFGFGDGD